MFQVEAFNCSESGVFGDIQFPKLPESTKKKTS